MSPLLTRKVIILKLMPIANPISIILELAEFNLLEYITQDNIAKEIAIAIITNMNCRKYSVKFNESATIKPKIPACITPSVDGSARIFFVRDCVTRLATVTPAPAIIEAKIAQTQYEIILNSSGVTMLPLSKALSAFCRLLRTNTILLALKLPLYTKKILAMVTATSNINRKILIKIILISSLLFFSIAQEIFCEVFSSTSC